ncbi:MAG: hypothetical protein V1688_00610, partial [bacterium]
DAKKNVIETGERCNVLQACRKEDNGSFECVNVEEGATECRAVPGSTESCPEGWFCIENICYNGSRGDKCYLNKPSCANGYYCFNPDKNLGIGATCFDGKEGDPCDSNGKGQCDEPMVCKSSIVGATCRYDRDTLNCLPDNAYCSGRITGNNECCSGDCDCGPLWFGRCGCKPKT